MKDKNKSLAIHSSIMPHMSNVTRAFILCLLLWFCGACAALEGEPKHVSAKEFMEYASLPMGTMVFSKYLGVSGGKALVEVHRMSYVNKKEWSKKIYWIEASALDPKDLESLQRLK